MQTLAQLREKFLDIEGVSFTELASDYPAVHVENTYASATIALHGAHLIEFTPRDSEAIIFTSKDAVYREGKAIRGGIPICWPWFNAHPTDKSLPAHGYARTSFWKLETVQNHKAGTTLSFTLPDEVSLNNCALSARLEIHIGKSLSLTLTTTNDGVSPETYSEALHSYFAVGDSKQVMVCGLDRASYIDTVGEEALRKQEGLVEFPDEVDRIYQSDASASIEDTVKGRRISIAKSGSGSTIVWNPGVVKGGAMADLNNDEISQFICVESGNAREQSIELAPGASHSLHLCISSQLL